MWKLPSGYTVFQVSNNGNQVTARKDSSTAAKPKLILIDRSEAVYNPATQMYSIPEYRVRVLYGTVNSEGLPLPGRLLADLTFRTPIGSEGDHAEWFADALGVVDEVDFLADGIQAHFLPDCCNSEASEG